MLKKNKRMIHFSGRRHTPIGICSTIIGIIVVIGFIALSIISAINHGKGGIVLGFVGLALFAFSVFGFVLSYKALKEKDVFYLFPVIGAVTNGIMTIVLFVLYILGLTI